MEIIKKINNFEEEIEKEINSYFSIMEDNVNEVLKKYKHELVPEESTKVEIRYGCGAPWIWIAINNYVLEDVYNIWKKYIKEKWENMRNTEELKHTLVSYNISKKDIDYIMSFNIFEKFEEISSNLKINVCRG